MANIAHDVQAAEEWRRYERVKSFYALRDERYHLLVKLLGGNFYSQDLITTQQITPEQASEIAQTTGHTLVVNRLAVVVKNYKNLMSSPPEMDVPARRKKDGTVSKEAEAHADRLEKLLYATWGANKMEMGLQGITHYASGLGSAPVEMWPDIKNKLMKYNVLRPWAFYPMTKGQDFSRYRYVCVESPMWGDELKEEYGSAFSLFNAGLPEVLKDEELYMVVKYVTDKMFSLLVGPMPGQENRIGDKVQDEPPLVQYGSQTILRLRNPLDFIPYINIPGNYIPHQHEGEGDIEQSIGLNYYVNEMFNTQADIMAFTANPIMVITGSNVSTADIPNRPGGGISLPEPGAKAFFLYPPNVAGDYFQQIQASMRFIEEQTGQPEPLMGRVQPSVESGSAIQALMGGVAATVSTKQRIYKVAFEQLNAMTLQGYEKMFPSTTISLQGSAAFFSGDYFAVELKGSEIDGWYANEVIYREGMQDFGSRLVNTLQMLGAHLISQRTARKILGVRSPIEEEAQIQVERLQEALLEGAKTRPPGDPQKEQQGLQRGRTQLPPPEQMAGALQALGGAGGPGQPTLPSQAETSPLPGPGAAQVDEQAVKRALGKQKYVGKVFLMSVGPEGISVAITREGDRSKVERALADLGAPVNIQVVSERPTEGVRIRGVR